MDAFREAIDKYCRKRLSKGVPSLGNDLSALLLVANADGKLTRAQDPVDVKAHPKYLLFVDIANEYITNLTANNKFSPDAKEEAPSTLWWAWYFRAILHELAGEYNSGIALVDKCLETTSGDAVDAYELKARLLKAGGDIKAAVECLDKGRELDKGDRYINNQTTKYMLQAGMEDMALERISLFTKHEGNPEQNLYDMQCSWYELELAESLARKEQWGKSLKKFGEFPLSDCLFVCVCVCVCVCTCGGIKHTCPPFVPFQEHAHIFAHVILRFASLVMDGYYDNNNNNYTQIHRCRGEAL